VTLRPHRVLILCIVAAALLTVAAFWPRGSSSGSPPPAAIYRLQPDNAPAPEAPEPADDAPSPPYEPTALARLEPGARLDDAPPEGWTHLIYKAHTRLQTGDVDALPAMARELAEFLFTAMAVRVAQDDAGRWQIEQVGIGLGTRVGEVDAIISSATHKQLGANLDWLRTLVLSRAEERLDLLRVTAGTPSMVVVDAPTLLRLDNQNRETVFRYLFLVEAETGGLATIVWRIETDDRGNYLKVASDPILATPSIITVTPLHVDGSRVTAGIPASNAFASTRMPDGHTFSMPEVSATAAGQRQLTKATAARLEIGFRKALSAMRSP
jgi:hypothetical protein